MDTTTQHAADASVDWIAQMRAVVVGAVALAVIVASMLAWAVLLDWAWAAHP
jgi:hypothetical protein